MITAKAKEVTNTAIVIVFAVVSFERLATVNFVLV